jgi:hypothetical protein
LTRYMTPPGKPRIQSDGEANGDVIIVATPPHGVLNGINVAHLGSSIRSGGSVIQILINSQMTPRPLPHLSTTIETVSRENQRQKSFANSRLVPVHGIRPVYLIRTPRHECWVTDSELAAYAPGDNQARRNQPQRLDSFLRYSLFCG